MKRCLSCFHEYNEKYSVCPYCGAIEGMGPKEPIHLMPGTLVYDRYVIGTSIGSGGFGIVYKAWDTKLETVVAVKEFFVSRLVTRAPGTKKIIVTRKSETEFQYRKKRFLEEARTMAKFSSLRNIPTVYEYFEENGTAYIVMELLEGMKLSEYLAEHGNKVEPDIAIQIASEVGDVLREFHKEGVIHCDVAPDNIYLVMGEELKVKLLDLGAAKIEGAETDVIDIVLKPGYSPPEQYDNSKNIGAWTDIYALGATLYVMLTGTKPDESTNRKIKDEVPSPKELNPEISENLSNTVMKAMAVDIHMRFKKDEDFQAAINGERKVIPVEQERKQRKAKRFTGLAAAFVAVAIIAAVVTHNFQEKREEGFLRPAHLDIWFSVTEGSSEEAAMQFITDDFISNFPDVTIDLKAIPEEDYADELVKAAKEDNLPNLFESTNLPDEVLAKAENLVGILDSEQADECLFLDQYKNVYKDTKQLPLGIEVPVAYIITAGETECEYTESYFSSLSDFGTNKTTIAGSSESKSLIESNFKDKIYLDESAFYDEGGNKTPVLISSTMGLNEFRNAFVGYGKSFAYYDAPQIHCNYVYEWSIGKGEYDETVATERLLSWMLGNAYQSALMITKNSEGQIPLNEICFHSKLESKYLEPIEKIYTKFVF